MHNTYTHTLTLVLYCRDFSASFSAPPTSTPSPPTPPSAAAQEAYSQAAYQAIEGLGSALYAGSVADYYGMPLEQVRVCERFQHVL